MASSFCRFLDDRQSHVSETHCPLANDYNRFDESAPALSRDGLAITKRIALNERRPTCTQQKEK
jgi:hypothetical protein